MKTPNPQIPLAAIVALLLLLLLLLPIFSPTPFTSHSLFLHLSSNSSAARHLHSLTLHPHVAGSPANSLAASYVLRTLSSFSLPTHILPYDVLLSYPLHRSLSLSPYPQSPPVPFDLVQQIYPNDPYADVAHEVMPTFHAYARSGTAVGEVVYANYGRVEDFETLRKAGVEVEGNVVVARYGGIFRGDIVRNAEIAGAKAVVVYTDAKDYGGGIGKWFPEERWMPPSGVQLGSVFRGLGDPTTPGWASVGGCERVGVEEVVGEGLMPGIPSLPVSSRDGELILKTVGGEVAADDWQGEEGGLVYRLGPGPGIVNLTYLVRS